MQRCDKGFTLLELSVGVSLLALLLTLCIQVLVPVLRHSSRTMSQSDLDMEGQTAINRLAADVAQTCGAGCGLQWSSVAVAAPPTAPAGTCGYPCQALAIDPLVGTDNDGNQVWAHQVIVYSCQGGRLTRKMYPAIGATSPLVWPADGPLRVAGGLLATLTADTSTEPELVSTHVADFRVWTDGGGETLISNPVHVFLRLSMVDASQAGPRVSDHERSMAMKQSL